MSEATATAEVTTEVPDLGLIEASGRYFIVRKATTAKQDHYIMARLEEAGLEKLKDQFGDDGAISKVAIEVMKLAYDNDILFEIVGAMLTETDDRGEPLPLVDSRGRPQKWTKEKADELANFVANLDDPIEKEQFNTIINATLILFFTTGVAPLMTSQSSSEVTAPSSPETPPLNEILVLDGSSVNDADALLQRVVREGDLDPTISENSPMSSET